LKKNLFIKFYLHIYLRLHLFTYMNLIYNIQDILLSVTMIF